MKTFSITCLLALFVTFTWAQDPVKETSRKSSVTVSGYAATTQETSRFEVNRSIKFSSDSGEEEISIEVPEGTKRLILEIRGGIFDGKFAVEVIDPDGAKKGNFSLSTQIKSGSDEQVSGHFEKHLKDPRSGTWIVRITPSKANGEINIKSSFIE